MPGGAEDVALQAAELLQTASIKHHPSPEHDINPSTAASKKHPVHLDHSPTASEIDATSDVDEDEIPISILRPQPRKSQLPPLPDLRFEQSYLASIKDTKSGWGVAYITVRDQVMMPLIQGMVWTLLVSGWRFWNRDTQLKGQSIGARIRRWWWGVNDWRIPEYGTGSIHRKKSQ
ncbi:DUF1770-domain-containing protein [Polychaeton citri CBS 116435]|uniref:DUF1770-domain-containing protein n=1 Tax=Polychaeton citri CBS 116435 TaxID=1314669 RepID=A0A9P4Q545_9PEZI|nr:DUF1770-domain-containing protein [Polychaeton citri CBS 116435]